MVAHSFSKLYCRPEIRNYVVNLDLPPEQRWQQIGRERSAQVIILICVYGWVKFVYVILWPRGPHNIHW